MEKSSWTFFLEMYDVNFSFMVDAKWPWPFRNCGRQEHFHWAVDGSTSPLRIFGEPWWKISRRLRGSAGVSWCGTAMTATFSATWSPTRRHNLRFFRCVAAFLCKAVKLVQSQEHQQQLCVSANTKVRKKQLPKEPPHHILGSRPA